MLNCFTVDEAARELGCTVRTVWRDLAVLQKANFPLYDDKDGRRVRYRLVDGFRAKLPAPFTLSEVVALLMSRDLLAPPGGSVLAPPSTPPSPRSGRSCPTRPVRSQVS